MHLLSEQLMSRLFRGSVRTLEKYKFMPGLKKLKRKAKITWNAEKAPCI